MPLAAYASAAGRLLGPASTLGGWVERPGGAEATLEGTVSRATATAWLSTTTWYRIRVRLAGEWLPSSDLVGSIEISWGLDGIARLASLSLVGERYLPTLTTTTWARTPIEIWLDHGQPGNIKSLRYLAGLVVEGEVTDTASRTVRLKCSDASALYDRWQVCREVAPLAGLTRGQICRQLAADAGIASTRIPDGAIYTSPVTANGERLLDFLREFGEPEGWYWRFDDAGVLEAYTADLLEAPAPPHHAWDRSQISEITLRSPKASPSRWIVRGQGSTLTDEAGLTSETTITEISALYAPKRIDRRQETDGSITDLSPGPPLERVRPVKRIIDTQQRRGGRTVAQITQEWGWYNPAAGYLRTPSGGEPPGPFDGLYYVEVGIEEGSDRIVAWPSERWVLVGERRQTWAYDAAGTATSTTITTSSWYTRTQGLRRVDGAGVAGCYVGGDDESYLPVPGTEQIERWGVSSIDTESYTYGPSGAILSSEASRSGYYAPRCHIGGSATDRWILHSGGGQTELVANWREIERTSTAHTINADGLLLGSSKAVRRWWASESASGPYDWGAHHSYRVVEAFTLVEVEAETNRIVAEDRYEATTIDAHGQRSTRLVHGALPVPAYKASPWTELVRTPIELLLDDPTVRAWFGSSSRVLNSDYVQSLAEAEAMIERARRRQIAYEVELVRPPTGAREGETVYLDVPELGLAHRGVIAEVRVIATMQAARFEERVLVEVPLL